jgi:carbon-monoxide dehydrogenase large subunit
MLEQLPKFVGARVKRKEDPRLITGRGTYVDDIRLMDMLHLEILRSSHAHARIKKIDLSGAKATPGVAAVFTGADLKELVKPLPFHSFIQGIKAAKFYPLAVEKVRFVGEGIAAVVATDRYVAQDALDQIQVEYDSLPAVVDPEKAVESGASLVHEEFGDNVAFRLVLGGGDVEAAMREADMVVRQRMVNQRLVPNAMETRGVLADYRPGADHLTVWSSTQTPHVLRSNLALVLNFPENKIRVVAPEVGGGFGAKGHMYPEDVLLAAVAIKLGKPVKWIEKRRESFVATNHGRSHVGYIEAGVKKDGTIAATRMRVFVDLGAYQIQVTPVSPLTTAAMQTGCYRTPIAQTELIGVYTNKSVLAPYRGAGRPEAAYYLERLMDLIARRLNLDPVEVRRRNFVPRDKFPYTTPSRAVYDSGNYEAALNRALEMLDYPKFRAEQERLRRERRYLGVGFSSWVEVCGPGPSTRVSLAPGVGGWESASVRIDPNGQVKVLTGASAHGQGHETSFAQIVADELGVAMHDVTVVHGDTDVVQYGVGTYGSRSLILGGSALLMALQKVKDKAKRLAAHAMEARPEDMDFAEGRIYVKGSPEKGMTFREAVGLAYRAAKLPPKEEPGLDATAIFDPPGMTYPFGSHVAVVEVDSDTGDVKLLRYIAVDDCGRVINPLLVEGQIQGGIAQGVGQALLEGALYDEEGQLATGSFMHYPMPTAATLPMIESDRTETPTHVNPLGAKGVGEAGTIAAAPAVVNAVVDALAPFGVTHIDMPLWPETVWRAIQAARG